MFVIVTDINTTLTAQYIASKVTRPCIIQRFFSFEIENFIGKNDSFNLFAQNMDCGYTKEAPRRSSSNGYPQAMFCNKNMTKNMFTPALSSFSIQKWC